MRNLMMKRERRRKDSKNSLADGKNVLIVERLIKIYAVLFMVFRYFPFLPFVVMIFCKNKWVITAYYLAAVTISMVFFSATNELFLLILCLSVTWIALMIVPSYVWREDVKVLKKAINTAYHEFKKKRYPVDANPEKIERRLEYAVILGAGKEYGEQ